MVDNSANIGKKKKVLHCWDHQVDWSAAERKICILRETKTFVCILMSFIFCPGHWVIDLELLTGLDEISSSFTTENPWHGSLGNSWPVEITLIFPFGKRKCYTFQAKQPAKPISNDVLRNGPFSSSLQNPHFKGYLRNVPFLSSGAELRLFARWISLEFAIERDTQKTIEVN